MSERGVVHAENVYGGRPDRTKKYVSVVSFTAADGLVTPLEIRWEDGRRYRIDECVDRRPARSLKTGGSGMRYGIRVGAARTYLYFDDDRKAWFVEAKHVADPC